MCVFEVDTANGLDKDAESEFTEITWIGYTIVDFKERDVSATVSRTGRRPYLTLPRGRAAEGFFRATSGVCGMQRNAVDVKHI